MVHILARIVVKPESAAAMSKIFTTLVEKSRAEPGCLSYVLYRRRDAPHVFQTVEQWADQGAADAHMATAHISAAIAAAQGMFAAAPEILAFEKVM